MRSPGLSRSSRTITGPLTPAILVVQDSPDGAPPSAIVLYGLACPLDDHGNILDAVRTRQEMAIEEAEDLVRSLQRLIKAALDRPARCPQR